MTMTRAQRIRRWIATWRRRWRHPVLARAIDRTSDGEIDAALMRAGLHRADLFTAANAIAQHRAYMAQMIAAFEINVERAAHVHWEDLKRADGACSGCSETDRCRRWLEHGRRNAAPQVFCPNAARFASIVVDQVKRRHGGHVS